jgi:predicted DNA-binding protein with PD1-like motif
MGRQQEQAGCLISGIGSLSVARLRLAGRRQSTTLDGDLEILSLAGTLSADGAHLHIAVADSHGTVIGGHLCAGSLVRTTAELVIGLLPDWRFSRELDAATGWAELQIQPAPDSDDHGESRCCRTARRVGWGSEPLVPFESPGRESARLSPDPCCR